MSDRSTPAPGEPGPDAASDPGRLLELLGPALSAETLDELLALGAQVAHALTDASAAALFLVAGRELSSEAWHCESDAQRVRVRPHLRGLAIESMTNGAPLTMPFPDGPGAAETPEVVLLVDRGHTIGVLCAACPQVGAAGQERRAARLALIAPLLARQIALRQEASSSKSTLARYERWFNQLDQHVRVLDRERQKFAAIVNQSDTYVFTTDAEGLVRWSNRATAARAPAGSEKGWIGRSCREVLAQFAGHDSDDVPSPVLAALASNKPAHCEIRQADEQVVHNFYVTALPIRGPEGAAHEALVIVQDLSGLDSLRLAELRLSTVVSRAPLVLFAFDTNGIITLFEGRGHDALGLGAGELVGTSAFDFHPEQPAIRGHVCRALAGEEFTTIVELGDVAFETTYSPVRDATGELTGVIGVAMDVSERRRLEEQLRHSHKMEGIGRLAGGVAHDFNNLLSVIMGNAELLLSQMTGGHPLRGCAEEVQRAGAQGALLTRQLLSFSRRDQPSLQRLDLNVVATEMETMLRRIIGRDFDIDIDTVRSADEALVVADRSQIEQVLMNLVVNARDAMPHGGRLTIHIEGGEPDEVALTVVDTGTGMTEAVRARLFEPFFTTKERGRGTGLGLVLVQGIVQGAGGSIAIESAEGRGTSVRVTLPRAAAEAAPERRAA